MSHQQVVSNASVKASDVLCGRGGATNQHPGNIEYRRIVASFQEEYLHSKKRDKRDIARRIVAIVRESNGRILKRVNDSPSGGWIDIGDKKAVEKTSQALREGLDQRRSEVGGRVGTKAKWSKKVKFVVRESSKSEATNTKEKGRQEDVQESVAEQWEERLRDMVSSNLPSIVSGANIGGSQPPTKTNSASGAVRKPERLTRRISSVEVVVPV